MVLNECGDAVENLAHLLGRSHGSELGPRELDRQASGPVRCPQSTTVAARSGPVPVRRSRRLVYGPLSGGKPDPLGKGPGLERVEPLEGERQVGDLSCRERARGSRPRSRCRQT